MSSEAEGQMAAALSPAGHLAATLLVVGHATTLRCRRLVQYFPEKESDHVVAIMYHLVKSLYLHATSKEGGTSVSRASHIDFG